MANLALRKFLKEKETGEIEILSNKCLVYIPENYFTSKAAYWAGDSCVTLGVIFFEFFLTEKSSKKFMMNVPLKLVIPQFRESFTVVKKFKNEEPKKYVVLSLNKGDFLFKSSRHIQTLDSIIEFLNLFNSGKLPENIPYSQITNIFKTAIQSNGMGLGVPSNLIEVMVAELTRVEKDQTFPFRIQAGRTGKDIGYKFIGVKAMAAQTSVFSAVSFENINSSIRSSVSKTRTNAEEYRSPIEEIMFF